MLLRLSTYIFPIFLFISCQDTNRVDYNPPVNTDKKTDIPVVEIYVTNPLGNFRLAKRPDRVGPIDSKLPHIMLDTTVKYQQMDGFGFAVTGGTASHLQGMSNSARSSLLNELFGQQSGELGMSLIRISIGASDLDESPFSYADTPGNEPDPALNSFSLSRDTLQLIPTLKEILSINPDIKIMASPWSPPVWMKSNKNTKGGSLLPEYYESYATYFVKYIEAMALEGIKINFLTPQNEPLHAGNNPSLYMTAAEQGTFIKGYLGPAFEKAGLDTKIIVYDHNADRTDYPLAILDDAEANPFVYGSAFHLYGGQITALSGVRTAHPDKRIYFTEQWYGAPGNFAEDLHWHIREIMIGSVRNWAVGVIEWNLSSNSTLTPHTDSGCSQCLGAVTIDGDQVVRNAGYYVVGHSSAFVAPGSFRIHSSLIDDLPNISYLTPDGEIVLLVLNDSNTVKEFAVEGGDVKFTTHLEAGSIATYIW